MSIDTTFSAVNAQNVYHVAEAQKKLEGNFEDYVRRSDERFERIFERLAKIEGDQSKLLLVFILQFVVFSIGIIGALAISIIVLVNIVGQR